MTNASALKVLVTGATGFLGSRIVPELLNSGHAVCAFARPTSNTRRLRDIGATIAIGEMTGIDSLRRAMRNVDIIVHAAADTVGTDTGGREITVGGTENVIRVAKELGIAKVVYISSCSVYAMGMARDGQIIDEDFALEPNPKARGPYSQYKREAEIRITEWMADRSVPVVCLRPGAVYGPGSPDFPAMLGFSIANKVFLVIGNGNMVPPWTHVDNVAEAVRYSVENSNADGKIFNIVDPENVSKRQYIQDLILKIHPSARVLYVPYSLIYGATATQEFLFKILRRKPFLTRYRLVASQCRARIDGSRIIEALGWTPKMRYLDAVAKTGRTASSNSPSICNPPGN